jgi:hypothetical protein
MRTYTFHVSLPDYDRVWRKVELPAEATLEWLHFAIQDAYNFNADHLYSFFMSGKAWDESTEYTLPEDVEEWNDDALLDEEADDAEDMDEDDDVFTEATGVPPGLLTGEQMPTPEQLRGMMQVLQSDPQARQQFMQAMSEQMGLPPAMVNMLMGNMESALSGMSDDQMNAILQMGNPFGDDDDEDDEDGEEIAGDVRATTLGSLQLHKGQNFLYLFDYGDEWRFNVRVHAINENGDPNAEYPQLVESVGEAPEQYPDWEEEEESEDEEDESK